MLDAASKAFFQAISRSAFLKRLATRYGLAGARGFARRFIAGEDVEQVIAAARAVESRGLAITLDYLGESVSSPDEADRATREYLDIIERVVAAGIERNVSLKLSQLGVDHEPALGAANLRRILDASAPHQFFVRIDMESSAYTDVTLDIFEALWRDGLRHVGVVLQSALRRSADDLRRVNALGARVRLVKGAYREPGDVAWQRKADVDAAYVQLTHALLRDGTYPAFATHDPDMVTAAKTYAAEHGVSRDRFEFQMLYGIRRDLQTSLAAEGYKVRVYIPFGREWFPYFMRRLGERPANVGFVIRSLLKEW
jgi:proline dehydrogenase